MDTIDMTREFIDNILSGNALGAEAKFQDIVSVKAHETLTDRKSDISNSLYNNAEQEQPMSDETGE